MRTILKVNLIFFHLEIDVTRAIGELRLLLRFNLVFLPLLAASFCAAGYVFRQQLRTITEEEVLENAHVMMQTARASRVYTTSQIAPLLDHEQSRVDRAIESVHQVLDEHLPAALQKAINGLPSAKEKQVLQNVRQQILESVHQQSREQPAAEFFPQCIPFYAATEAFNYFRTQYPDYAYKEAALNPMNPRDRTIEWEADIVSLFIKAPAKTEFFGRRETPLGTSLYYSAPIRVDNESCLACHGTSDKAPPEMVKLYGTANGFGWKLHDVIGAQIVSVPANLPDRAADDALKRTLWWLVAIFGALFLLVNLAFYLFSRRVVKPSQLPGLANKGQAS